ncbi:MAG: hypothetical protein AB7D28_03710 [Candidatus Berkiella sp.]
MLENISWTKAICLALAKGATFIKTLFPKISNLYSRPKIEIMPRLGHIVFQTDEENAKKQYYQYLLIQISNRSNSKLCIQPGFIRINNEAYQVNIQSDINFSKMTPNSQHRWTYCDNEIYNIFQDNWVPISEKRFTYNFEPHYTLYFPIKFTLNLTHQLKQVKKDSLLFFPNKKISLTLNINGKNKEYCISKKEPLYELLLNHLASELSRSALNKI